MRVIICGLCGSLRSAQASKQMFMFHVECTECPVSSAFKLSLSLRCTMYSLHGVRLPLFTINARKKKPQNQIPAQTDCALCAMCGQLTGNESNDEAFLFAMYFSKEPD